MGKKEPSINEIPDEIRGVIGTDENRPKTNVNQERIESKYYERAQGNGLMQFLLLVVLVWTAFNTWFIYRVKIAGELETPKQKETEVVDRAQGQSDAGKDVSLTAGPSYGFVEMPEIITAIEVSGEPKQLVVGMVLEVREGDKAFVEGQISEIKAVCEKHLSNVRIENLRGSGGFYQFKEKLTKGINDVVGEGKVKDVIIKSMLIR